MPKPLNRTPNISGSLQSQQKRDFEVVNSAFVKKQYDDLLKFAQEKVFDDKQYQQFRERIEARYKPSIETNRLALSEYLYDMRSALEEQERLNKIDNEVRKKQAALEANRKDDSQHTPGDLKVEWFQWMATLMGQEYEGVDQHGRKVKTGTRWNTLYDHHDNLDLNPDSKKQSIKAVIDSPYFVPSQLFPRPGGAIFRKGPYGSLFPYPPKRLMSLDETLSRARDFTRSEREKNLRDIDDFLHTGYMPKHRKSGFWNEFKHRTSPITEKIEDGSEMMMDLLNWGIQKAGRGIYSKSDPKKSDLMRTYKQTQTDLLSNLLWKLNVDPSAHANLMQRIKKAMESTKEDDLLDPASFKQITDLLEQEIKSANLGYDTQIGDIMKKMNELNKAMYEDVKKKVITDDEQWKYKLLQGFLMVSPFMGIAYMTPFLNAFSGVFLNSGGLGDGIASLATSEHTGIFGSIADAIGVDDLIQFILNDVPIIKDIVGILNYLTQNTIFQGIATSIILPVAGGQIMTLAIPAAGLVYGGAKTLEDYEKNHKIFYGKNGHFAKLEKAVIDLWKNTKNHAEKRKDDANKAINDLIAGKIQDGVVGGKPTFKDTAIKDLEHQKLLKSTMNNLLLPNLTKEQIAEKRLEIKELVMKAGFNPKKQKITLDALHKIFDDFHEGPNITQLVTNIDKTLEEAYNNKFRAEFWEAIYSMDKPKSGIMKRLVGSALVGRLTEAGVIADGEFHVREMLQFLVDEKNKSDVRMLELSSLLVGGIKADGATNEEKIENILLEVERVLQEENSAEREEIIAIQQKLRGQVFVEERALNQGISLDDLPPIEDDMNLEKVLARQSEIDKLREKTIESAIKEIGKMVKLQGVIEKDALPNMSVGVSPKVVEMRQLSSKERSEEAANGIMRGRGDAPIGVRT